MISLDLTTAMNDLDLISAINSKDLINAMTSQELMTNNMRNIESKHKIGVGPISI